MKGILYIACVLLAVLTIGSGGNITPVLKKSGTDPGTIEIHSPFPTLDDEVSHATRSNYWDVHLVDADDETDVGKWTSIALDSNNLPHISYNDASQMFLKYAHYDGSEWSIETVDGTAEGDHVGKGTSIALDSSDHPHISYYDGPTRDLKYAHFDGAQWSKVTVDSDGEVGKYTSIALNSSGMPHIAYLDMNNSKLKYAYFDGVQWNIETLPMTEDVDRECSLVLDSSDNPHICYYDLTHHDLKYMWFDGAQWHTETVDSQGELGRWPSLQLDSDERPHISYREERDGEADFLKYAYFDGVIWNTEYVDKTGSPGRFSSLALDSTDAPHISYLDRGNNDEGLKYAHFDGAQWSKLTVDSDGEVGRYTSMAMGANDTPHISYYDFSTMNLRYAVMDKDNDHVPPELEADNSPGSSSAGDTYHFNISASDNWYIDTLYVNWSHGNLGGNISLTDPEGDGTWVASITLDENTSGLIYTVYIKDTSGNYYVSTATAVPVYDDDLPVLLGDDTTDTPRTGELMDFYVRAMDNIGVGSVFLSYSFHAGTYLDTALVLAHGHTWEGAVRIPTDAAEMDYYFLVSDLAGNELNTKDTVGEVHLSVLDIIDPIAYAGPDLIIDQHGNATLDARSSTDNIAITNYTWTFIYDGTERILTEDVVTFKFSIVGDYNVTLNVSDKAGNRATDMLLVTDKDVIPPVARAGEDVTVEASLGVELNGSGSTDNVGIAEYIWTFTYRGMNFTKNEAVESFIFHKVGDYTIILTVRDEAGNNGTDTVTIHVIPVDDDSDDDGMPDVWEGQWGFDKDDPDDAEMDKDGDGYTNLQECNMGSCPWDPYDPDPINGEDNPEKDEKAEKDWSWVIVGIGIIIVGIMVLLFSRKKNDKAEKAEEPSGRIEPVLEKEEDKKKTKSE